jgi:hypothetical protein
MNCSNCFAQPINAALIGGLLGVSKARRKFQRPKIQKSTHH